jgi:hypothetical protein
MKRIVFFSMIYFLLFGCNNLMGKNNDPKHPESLIGSWISADSADSSVLILRDNGSYEYLYIQDCETKKCSDAGTWEIRDSAVNGKTKSFFCTANNGHPYCAGFELSAKDGADFLTLTNDEEPPILKLKRQKK